MIVAFLLLTEAIRREAKNQIHVRVFQSSENGLRTTVLLFTIALSFLYFGVVSMRPGGSQKSIGRYWSRNRIRREHGFSDPIARV